LEESYFAEATHAAEGSYYIEEISKQLIEKTWKEFSEMEQG
jgi:methylmalonyl-CoA mutase N-terminal domain/subunit